MKKIIPFIALFLIFGCQNNQEKQVNYVNDSSNTNTSVNNVDKEQKNVKSPIQLPSYKHELVDSSLFIIDESFAWDPFPSEKNQIQEIQRNYNKLRIEQLYNEHSGVYDTLIYFGLSKNKIFIYSSQDEIYFSRLILKNNDVKFKKGIEIGLSIDSLLSIYHLDTLNSNSINTIDICDEDKLQEVILFIRNDTISEINFEGYSD